MPFVPDADGGKVYEPMDCRALQAIRRELGMKKVQFGQLLGLTGKNRNIYVTVSRYEDGRRYISPMLERLALMLIWFKREQGYIPDLDAGDMHKMLKVEERANG